MKEYPKIETLYDRDEKFKVMTGAFRLPEFEYLKNNKWLWTEKVDGTNIRVMWDGEKVSYGGKTDNAQIPTFLLKRLDELFSKEGMLSVFDPEGYKGESNPQVCFYGEGYGTKIQKGGGNYKADGVDFVLFDIWIDGWWLDMENMLDISGKLGLTVVPVVGGGSLHEATEFVRDGFESKWGHFPAEGIVLKPEVELHGRRGQRILAKLKTKDF